MTYELLQNFVLPVAMTMIAVVILSRVILVLYEENKRLYEARITAVTLDRDELRVERDWLLGLTLRSTDVLERVTERETEAFNRRQR